MDIFKIPMSKNTLITAVIIIVVLVAGWYLLRPRQTAVAPTPSSVVATPAPTEASSAATTTSEKNLVNITASGFSPKTIIIKAGDSVTWENTDSADHTVNSAVHPTHLVYPPLNLDVIKPGEKKPLNFPKAGTYQYHDHLNPSLTGSVTVQ